MLYSRLESRSKVTLLNHAALRRFWKTLTPTAQLLVGRVRVERPLTANQLNRLPRELAAKLA